MLLRPYQSRSIADLRQAFASGSKACCLVLPTGAGKTVIAASMIQQAVAKGRRVLFLVHRVELVDQAVSRLSSFGVPAGEIVADRTEDRSHHVQVASIQTLLRRDFPPADIVFIDEGHHAAAASYLRVLQGYKGRWIIGLSATPARLDGKPLSDVFDRLVIGPTTQDLVDQGVLLNPVIYSHPNQPNLKGVRSVAGDYAQAELARRMEEPKLIGSIVDHWKELTRKDSRGVAYAVNIQHSHMIVDALSNSGVAAVHIDGSSPSSYRAEAIERLRQGEVSVISNCMVLTEGWDLPELDVAVCARPTQSIVLWRQMVGRIMRTTPGKDGCTVLDHAGNAIRLGLPTDSIEWSLDGVVKKPVEVGPKACPVCFAMMPRGVMVCPQCGANMAPEDRDKEQKLDGKGKLERVSLEDRKKAYEGWVLEAARYGRKLGWARVRYKERFHVWPVALKELEKLYVCPKHKLEPADWGGLRCLYCLRKNNPEPHPSGNR